MVHQLSTISHLSEASIFSTRDWPTGEGMWAEDRFHPNDEAYKYIANNLWTSLVKNLLI